MCSIYLSQKVYQKLYPKAVPKVTQKLHHGHQFRFGGFFFFFFPGFSPVDVSFLFFAWFLALDLPCFVAVVRTTGLEVGWLLSMKDEEGRGPWSIDRLIWSVTCHKMKKTMVGYTIHNASLKRQWSATSYSPVTTSGTTYFLGLSMVALWVVGVLSSLPLQPAVQFLLPPLLLLLQKVVAAFSLVVWVWCLPSWVDNPCSCG